MKKQILLILAVFVTYKVHVMAQPAVSADSVQVYMALSRQGDTNACLKLAECYRKGIGVMRSFLQMAALIERAEQLNDYEAAESFVNSLPIENEDKKALQLNKEYKLRQLRGETLDESKYENEFLRLAKENPDVRKGKEYWETIEVGDTAKAIGILRDLVIMAPTFYNEMGLLYERMNDGDEAIRCFLEADRYGVLTVSSATLMYYILNSRAEHLRKLYHLKNKD